MTAIEVAKILGLAPKDIIHFIDANATFYVKKNYQTGDVYIPDDVDINKFFEPLITQQEAAYVLKLARKQQEQQQALQTKRKIQQEQQAQATAEQAYAVAVQARKQAGAEGYYQYKVISLLDASGLFKGNSGRVNVEAMTQTLNQLGIDGWRLVTAYSNELGKNAASLGIGGFISGTNSTVDENILIFERFVKYL